MKKYCSIISIVLLGSMLLFGCSGKGGEALKAKEPVTVTFWHYYNDAQKNGLDNIVAEYNETIGKEKNITVEAVGLGSIDDITTKVSSVLKNQEAGLEKPNMFLAYRDTLQEIQKESPDAFLDYKE